MAGNNLKLKLPEVQFLISCIIDSLGTNKARSREEHKLVKTTGSKLRRLEKTLVTGEYNRSQKHGRIRQH